MTIVSSIISSSQLWSALQNFSWYVRRDRDIDFFFCPTDPHSYLALQALGTVIAHRYPSAVIRIWLCGPAKEAGLEAYAASPEEQEAWQLRDARYLADLYKDIGIKYDPKITGFTPKLRLCAIQSCLKIVQNKMNHSDGSFVLSEEVYKQILAAEELIYSGNEQALQEMCEGISEETAKRCMENSAAAILRKGHFNTGFIRFGFEYFWGIDRLGYLEQQLIHRGLAIDSSTRPVFVRTHQLVMRRSPFVSKPIVDPSQVVIEMFWSFRSPYSQVVLKQIFALADAYRVRLSLRLVLPMVMRGLTVPVAKQVYILFDTSREARLQNDVEFGNCADPVGAGVERAFAVFQIAKREGKEREFLLSWAKCVWAKNVVADSDEGIWRIAREAGLSASRLEVIRVAKQDSGEDASWRKEVETNRTRLYELGLWGVPSFAFQGDSSFALWGQDRLFQLEKEIIQRLEGKQSASTSSSSSSSSSRPIHSAL